MLIYEIASDSHLKKGLQEDASIRIENVEPSRFTFVTSMRIATLCKYNTPDTVIAYAPCDAMAAISARKIHQKNKGSLPYPIILYITTSEKIPLSIHTDLAKDIDAILYENEKVQKKWSEVKNIDKIRRHENIPLPAVVIELANKESHGEKLVIGYVGPLGSCEKIKKLINTLIGLPHEKMPEIIIAGVGKARYVMPAVKLARANNIDIKWQGEECDVKEVMEKLDGFFISGDTFSNEEKILLANGIPALNEDNFEAWMNDIATREKMQKESKKLYDEDFNPDIFKTRLSKLL